MLITVVFIIYTLLGVAMLAGCALAVIAEKAETLATYEAEQSKKASEAEQEVEMRKPLTRSQQTAYDCALSVGHDKVNARQIAKLHGWSNLSDSQIYQKILNDDWSINHV